MAKVLIPWIGALTALFLAIFALPGAYEGLVVADEVDGYRSTRADVKGQFEREHKFGPALTVVEFTYRIDGRKYFGDNQLTIWTDDEETVSELIRKEKDGRKTLLVWYDPDNPRRSTIRREVSRLPHIAWIGATLIIGLWAVFAVRNARRRKRIVEQARQRRRQSRPL